MNNEFCNYNQSLALKELGFDEPCFGYYVDGELRGVNLGMEELGGVKPYYERFGYHTINNHHIENKDKIVVTSPLKQQSFKFFREKYGYYSEIRVGFTQIDGSIGYEWWIWEPNGIEEWSPEAPGEEWSYDTYEDAENACLDKLIEIVKNKK
jgi:hypothetical protein